MIHGLPRTTKLSNHKRTDHLASPCQLEALVMAGKAIPPYAAECWQGAPSTSLTAPCALWTAAEVVALLCRLLLLQQESSGTLGSGARYRTTGTPTARQRTQCTTSPGRID